MTSYVQWRDILKNERLPAVVVDLDAFDRNVAKLASMLKGSSKTLRLASKSVRVPSLLKRVLKAGAPYQGLMCFCAEEAAYLSAQGFDDLLIAYPTSQPSDLAILRRLHEAGTKVTIVVDGDEGVGILAAFMKGTAKPFPVVIDLDVSLRWLSGLVHLGVRRSPVRDARDLGRLLDVIGRFAELRPIGALAYEAQVAGLGDRNPFKPWLNPFVALIRKLSVGSVARTRAAVAVEFAARKLKLELFNGGGTGSVNYAVVEEVLTELSAGSGLLCSHLFDYYSNVHFEPACFFALQAVRSSDSGYVTCLGGGYVASGEPSRDRLPVPYLPEGSRLVSMEGVGEVQTPIQLGLGVMMKIGEPVLFRHAKAGELAERFDEYLLVSGGRIVERARTYRGQQQCYF